MISAAWFKVAGLLVLTIVVSAHVGSPNVFFAGQAGPYDIRVVIRAPEVVPGIARVTVRTGSDVRGVMIRPVFWRAGSRGAPSADETRRLAGEGQTFEGSLWLMARGAYSVDVIVEGDRGRANVLVPVASVATGQLQMGPALGILLIALGALLVIGLITIVYKGAGESLVEPGQRLEASRRRGARRVVAVAVPIIALALFGGARWWRAVDTAYERTIYRPSPLQLARAGRILTLQATDTVFQPPRRPSPLVPDHGKLMHLFLVRADDARAFAHLHPIATDSSANPRFVVALPPLPAAEYRAYGDVVHETGFERTLVGTLTLDAPRPAAVGEGEQIQPDPDDAWYVGDASRERLAPLADGSTMELELEPNGVTHAERDEILRITVRDREGRRARLEPYLGMTAHAVVARVDGAVYVHLHPMGTVTSAAQQTFLARDRGDTTEMGRLRLDAHGTHSTADIAPSADSASVEFPYAFPRSGSYRLFVQVKRAGRILTGAFAITVAEPATDGP
jgi:hypothetical protein